MSESYYPEWDTHEGDYYPGSDDDEDVNADGDRYDETPVQGIFPDIPDDEELIPEDYEETDDGYLIVDYDDDSLYPECEHTPPCTGDRENAPCYAADDWPSEPEDWRHGEPAGDE